MTTKKPQYWEQIKDPRWQKLRLQILKRDNFQCQRCGDTAKELHVHHDFYISGFLIWDYDQAVLKTLCCDCHVEVKLNSECDGNRLMIAADTYALVHQIPRNQVIDFIMWMLLTHHVGTLHQQYQLFSQVGVEDYCI